MLRSLAIQDVVLIDRLELTFQPGLCVLTGETGAGKSILLDSLGLVLGSRADTALIRVGAERAMVSAEFVLADNHPALQILESHGFDSTEPLLIRRSLGRDGRSRAFINDQPVSIGFLRDIGECLVEIHGQFDSRALLQASGHRALLDAFGGLQGLTETVGAKYRNVAELQSRYAAFKRDMEAAQREEEYLRHVYAELSELDPQAGEEAALADQRAAMMRGEKIRDQLREALALISADDGPEARLGNILRHLERAQEHAPDILDPVVAGIDRSFAEAMEAHARLREAVETLEFDPQQLDQAEERLFALRSAARKHRCSADDLPALRVDLEQQLTQLDDNSRQLEHLQAELEAARTQYRETAKKLSARRLKAARRLDQGVSDELAGLRLGKAVFKTCVESLAEEGWNEFGADRVEFKVATVTGAEPGPLARIASGGEFARFVLALKVILAGQGSAETLVFDEVDSGVGGAVADAVGARLARLARNSQILVVTHSPQVAAKGNHHLRIRRVNLDGAEAGTVSPIMVARIDDLDESGRREEIARMLAGAEITDAARGAAESLMKDKGA